MKNIKRSIYILAAVSLLIVVSLACQSAGEIISVAEATQRYEATQAVLSGNVSGDAEGALFTSGEKAFLIGDAYLIALYQQAGETVSISFATRGDEITILGSVLFEGEVWYKIESLAGSYWLPETSLEPPE